MNRDEVQGLFIAIEDQMDVLEIKYQDLHLWPLVRTLIWNHLNARTEEIPNLERMREIAYATEPPKKNAEARKFEPRAPRPEGGLDALVFCRSIENTINLNGWTFNQYLDSYVAAIEDRLSVLKFEIIDSDFAKPRKYRFPTTYLPSPLPTEETDAMSAEIRAELDATGIPGLDRMNAIIESFIPGEYLPADNVVDPIVNIQIFRKMFERLLRSTRPRAVILICYYYDIGFALLCAAKDLGIPTVEIAHGSCGQFSYPYTHWRCFPDDGYKLLPDYFWTWSERDADCVARWFPQGAKAPLVEAGGNPGLLPEPYRDLVDGDADFTRYLHILKFAERVILVPLTFYRSGDLPEFVEDAIAKSPPGWLWLIRGHPQYFREKLSEIDARLAPVAEGRYEIGLSTLCPLPLILEHCDQIVGPLSSIIMDGLAQGIQTTFIGDYALDIMPDLIADGTALLAKSTDQILDIVANAKRLDPTDFEYQISTSKERVMAAMDRILAD